MIEFENGICATKVKCHSDGEHVKTNFLLKIFNKRINDLHPEVRNYSSLSNLSSFNVKQE